MAQTGNCKFNRHRPTIPNSETQSIVSERFGFDSENIFSAKITLDKHRKRITIYFLVHHPDKSCCRVEEVECCAPSCAEIKENMSASPTMKSPIQMFDFTSPKSFEKFPKDVLFFVKMSSTIANYDFNTCFLDTMKTKNIAERSFDLRTSGLWAQHASAAPLCSITRVKLDLMNKIP